MTMVPSFNTSGALRTYELYTQSVPANAVYNAGQAQKSSGQIYVAVITGAVPATAVYMAGLAFTQDGQLYATYDAVAATDVYIAGLRCTKDGAVRINTTSTSLTTSMAIPTWGYATTTGILQTTQNYGSAPGTAGNYFSTPDSIAASITGDIDIRLKLAADDWTPAATDSVIGKWEAEGVQSYILRILTSGVLRLTYTADGTTDINRDSTAATGLTDGTANWIRVTLDVDNGAAGNDVNFYTSTDGVTWTQLGTTVTNAGATSIFDSTAAVEVAARNTGTAEPFAGKVYRAQIYNGINGTLAVDFNAGDALVGGTTWTSRTTGEVWTVNGTASVTS